MSQGTLLTKEFFLEYLGTFQEDVRKQFAQVRSILKEHDEQFVRIHSKLKEHDAQFIRIHSELKEHDELLEMIAGEVSGTQNLLNELAPTRNDHETRITRLERGFTKLILKS